MDTTNIPRDDDQRFIYNVTINMSLLFKRLKQVLKFGWLHSGVIQTETNTGIFFRTKIFIDILYCFNIYKMWSNQYLKEKFYSLSKEERKLIGDKYFQKGVLRDERQKDFDRTKRFLAKYTCRKYDIPTLVSKREEAYTKYYNMGDNCVIEHNVELSRQHYLHGPIKIGNNVLLARNVLIDYSGDVVIEDGVKISADVKIESHGHASYANAQQTGAYKTPLHIEKNVRIGTGTIIMEGCKRIGKEARIGAGSVIRSNIPPYAIVIGNPAKIIGFSLSPEELETYEEGMYTPEERTNIDQFKKIYERYLSSRSKDIIKLLKL